MVETPTTTANSAISPLMDRLLTEGWKFQFFQATWLLERFSADRVPVGGRGPVEAEALRFRPDVSMGFPPSDVRRIVRKVAPGAGRAKYVIDVSFMGVYGVSTPLPMHYAVDVLRSVDRADSLAGDSHGESDVPAAEDTSPVRDFLDIFHHRVISLFYRSWLKYRYDMAFGLPTRALLTDYLLWLIGCPRSFDHDALGLSSIRMIRYAGVLTQRPRSASLLEGLLKDYWEDLDIEVQQCVGRWVPLNPSDWNHVGSVNCGLGIDLTVGEEVYDLTGAFAVSIGPLDWDTYQSFLPDGAFFAQTRSLVQLYCMDPLYFNVELQLRAGQVPEMRLASGEGGTRLGYTSWVRTDEIPKTSVVFSSKRKSQVGGAVEESGANASAAATEELAMV